jgi:hypothetical protein
VAVLLALVVLAGGRTYDVAHVRASFRAHTGLPLVRFADASTSDVTALRSRPHRTRRFGEFQIFVFRPAAARRLARVFTRGGRPDARGIYWVPDLAGGWIAVTLFPANLCVGWFPPAGARQVDERWQRLQAVARALRP